MAPKKHLAQAAARHTRPYISETEGETEEERSSTDESEDETGEEAKATFDDSSDDDSSDDEPVRRKGHPRYLKFCICPYAIMHVSLCNHTCVHIPSCICPYL